MDRLIPRWTDDKGSWAKGEKDGAVVHGLGSVGLWAVGREWAEEKCGL